jgi:hypothetical protein
VKTPRAPALEGDGIAVDRGDAHAARDREPHDLHAEASRSDDEHRSARSGVDRADRAIRGARGLDDRDLGEGDALRQGGRVRGGHDDELGEPAVEVDAESPTAGA